MDFAPRISQTGLAKLLGMNRDRLLIGNMEALRRLALRWADMFPAASRRGEPTDTAEFFPPCIP